MSPTDLKTIVKYYCVRPAAYGSVRNPSSDEAKRIINQKLPTSYENALMNYKQMRRNFTPPSYSCSINEVWSIDIAHMDKLSKCNNGVDYVLVAVDVLSRYLRVILFWAKNIKVGSKSFLSKILKRRPDESLV